MNPFRLYTKANRVFWGIGLVGLWGLTPVYLLLAVLEIGTAWRILFAVAFLFTAVFNAAVTFGGGYRYVIHGKD